MRSTAADPVEKGMYSGSFVVEKQWGCMSVISRDDGAVGGDCLFMQIHIHAADVQKVDKIICANTLKSYKHSQIPATSFELYERKTIPHAW